MSLWYINPSPFGRGYTEYRRLQPNSEEGQVFVGQMYVEQLTPRVVKHQCPLVFIAGSGQTGTVR